MKISKDDLKKLKFEERMTFLTMFNTFQVQLKTNIILGSMGFLTSVILVFLSRAIRSYVLVIYFFIVAIIFALGIVYENEKWNKIRKELVNDYFKIEVKK